MSFIHVENLTKCYNDVEVVKGISFTVKKGSLFAFLGRNGAGKSTTIEILCTLLEKTSGTVRIDGYELGTIKGNDAIRRLIGVVFQQSVLDNMLSVKENILHRGRFYRLTKKHLQENYQFVKQYLQLDDIENKKYGELSGGQRRRADIGRALIHKPALLFLDEPTTGLDPHTRQFVWATIERLQKETGMTIFLTTHYMEEATNADDIVIIKKGKIIAQGTPSKLKELYATDYMYVHLKQGVAIEDFQHLFETLPVKMQDGWKIELPSTTAAIPLLQKMESYIETFEVVRGTLDQVFIEANEK